MEDIRSYFDFSSKQSLDALLSSRLTSPSAVTAYKATLAKFAADPCGSKTLHSGAAAGALSSAYSPQSSPSKSSMDAAAATEAIEAENIERMRVLLRAVDALLDDCCSEMNNRKIG